MRKFLEALSDIEVLSGTKAKENKLREALEETPMGVLILEKVYNDEKYGVSAKTIESTVGYSKTLGTYSDVGELVQFINTGEKAKIRKPHVVTFFTQLSTLSGNALKQYLLDTFSTYDKFTSKWLARMATKDLRIGINHKTVNKVLKSLNLPEIEKFGVQLCGKLESVSDDKITYPICASVKYDGMRCVVEKKGEEIIFTSRQGKNIDFVPELEEAFKQIPIDTVVLDGELMCKNFTELSTRIGRKKENLNEVDDLHFTAYDILYCNIKDISDQSQSLRMEVLKKLVKDLNIDQIRLEEHKICYNEETLKSFYQEIKDRKEEGLVLKLLDAPYEKNSRDKWFKLKPKLENTFQARYCELGSGKYKDKISRIHVFDKAGKVQSVVGTGFSDEIRDEIMSRCIRKDEGTFVFKIPTFIDVEYFQISTKKDKDGKTLYSLRHPRFLKLRDDKAEADEVCVE